MTFVDFDIFHQMTSLWKIVLRDLDLNFQGKTFEMVILTGKRWKLQILLFPSDSNAGICHRVAPLRVLYIITLTYIFKVTNYEYVENGET